MAGQDIEMNAFKIASDAPYIYVELADGSQGKIKKSDLIELVKSGLGYSYLKNSPVLEIADCNSIGLYANNGLYSIGEHTLNTPEGARKSAILLVLSRGGYYYQEYVDVINGARYFRYLSTSWSQWRKI